MKYKELKELLIEHMDNGSTMTLKSLLNTLIQCDDIQYIYFCYESYKIASKDYEDIRMPIRTNYMTGFIRDKHDYKIYNSVGIHVYNGSGSIIGCIWFGKEGLISLHEGRDRYNNRIKNSKIDLADNVNLIRIDNNRVDYKTIFKEGRGIKAIN